MKQVNEIIKNQTRTTSNQEGWNKNNIIKALKASAEKNLGYNHKEIQKQRPKNSATFIDSDEQNVKDKKRKK